MEGNTNRDLLLNLQESLAAVVDGEALNGYRRQLENAEVERTREELAALEYLEENVDLAKIDQMLSVLLAKDHTAVY